MMRLPLVFFLNKPTKPMTYRALEQTLGMQRVFYFLLAYLERVTITNMKTSSVRLCALYPTCPPKTRTKKRQQQTNETALCIVQLCHVFLSVITDKANEVLL